MNEKNLALAAAKEEERPPRATIYFNEAGNITPEYQEKLLAYIDNAQTDLKAEMSDALNRQRKLNNDIPPLQVDYDLAKRNLSESQGKLVQAVHLEMAINKRMLKKKETATAEYLDKIRALHWADIEKQQAKHEKEKLAAIKKELA